MSQYRCPLRDKLKPSNHDEWHWDGQSSVCPVLRDELIAAVEQEKWKRLEKLVALAKVNQIF